MLRDITIALAPLLKPAATPHLGVFLGVMQSVHNEIQVHVRQLERGTAPNQLLPQYVQNEVNIQLGKDFLQEWLLTVQFS